MLANRFISGRAAEALISGKKFRTSAFVGPAAIHEAKALREPNAKAPLTEQAEAIHQAARFLLSRLAFRFSKSFLHCSPQCGKPK